MSNSVDRRIVSMGFENKQFEENIGTTLSSLDKLKQSLNFGESGKAFAQIQSSAEKVDLASMQTNLEKLTDRFSTLGIIGMTALQNITNSAMNTAKELYKTFAIEPKTSGFAEYELKMGSIQTIMAGTGESLETVNGYLDELNEYSDKTIYSFADMTSNIGKFTNAGVSLDESVKAIQGVANVAALSGANSNEASRAMYNFAQSLAQGSVKLIDWKSIENANMATAGFKDQLIQTAVEMGTLTKEADGLYYTLDGTEVNTRNFNTTLEKAWLTSEALVGTLGKYSDETTEIGKKATAAAQDVKTFSMMMDTLKEGVQSGWAQTFEILVGDFEEAKELFTNLSNSIGGWLGSMAEARNSKLQIWKDLGGREKLIQGLTNVFTALGKVIGTVKEAFANIFPPGNSQGETLYKLTEGFEKFTRILIPSDGLIKGVKSALEGFFTIIKSGVDVVKAIADRAGDMYKNLFPDGLGPLIQGVAGVFSGFAEAVKDLAGAIVSKLQPPMSAVNEKFGEAKETVKEFGETLNSGINTSIETLGNKMQTANDKVKGFGDYLKDTFGPVISFVKDQFSKLVEMFQGFSMPSLGEDGGSDLLNAGLIGVLILLMKKLTDFKNDASGIIESIGDIFRGVSDALNAFTTSIKADALKKIAISIGILTVAIIALSMVDREKLSTALSAMAIMMTELMVAFKLMEKVEKGTGMGAIGKIVLAITGISTALIILAGAIKIMEDVEVSAIVKSLTVMVTFLGSVAAMAIVMEKGNLNKVAGTLLSLSSSMVILAGAIKLLGMMDTNDLLVGMAAMTGIMAVIALTIKTMKGKDAAMAGSTFVGIAASMVIFAGAIKLLGSMDMGTLALGIAAILAVLVGLGLAVETFDNNMKGAGAMVVIAGAVLVLAGALKVLASIPGEALTVALVGMAAGIGILVAALIILANPTLSGGILTASVALLAFGAAIVAIGGGLLLISTAMAALTVTMMPFLLALGAALMEFVPMAMDLLTGLMNAIAEKAPELVESFLNIIIAIIEGITAKLPELIDSGMSLIVSFIQGLADGIEKHGEDLRKAVGDLISAFIGFVVDTFVDIWENGSELLQEWIGGIGSVLGDVISMAGEVIGKFLQGVIDWLGDVWDAGVEMIGEFLEGIASWFGNVFEKGKEVVGQVIDGIVAWFGNIVNAGKDIVRKVIEGITSFFSNIFKSGKEVAGEVVDGVKNSWSNIIQVGKDIIGKIVGGIGGAIGGVWDAAVNVGKNIIDGVTSGVRNFAGNVRNAVANVGSGIINGFKGFLGIASPAKKLIPVGRYIDEGIIVGLMKTKDKVVAAAKNVGTSTMNTMKSAVKKAGDLVDADVKPAIRPVLDLDAIKEGAKKIAGMLDQPTLTPSLAAVNGASNSFVKMEAGIYKGQSSKETIGANYQVNVGGTYYIREEADIKKVSEQLAREIERKRRA